MRALLLFAAVLIAAELLHRRDSELGTVEEDDRFSPRGRIAVAAAVLIGPWSALVASGISVGVVRRLQGDGWQESAARAISLGGAAFAGGFAYFLGGGETGSVLLPDDLMAVALLGVRSSP